MNEFEERVQRTWTKLLLDMGNKQAAAMAIDSQITVVNWETIWLTSTQTNRDFQGKYFTVQAFVPTSAWLLVNADDHLKSTLLRTLEDILTGRSIIFEGEEWFAHRVEVQLGVQLVDFEVEWEQVVRKLIAQKGVSNQGLVSEKASARRNAEPLIYNELKFASQSEIRIAQEFERRGTLFFPLAVAVRYSTGNYYQDHREIDFLVCQDGVWGVLEVSYHPDRYELDSEKTLWLKEAGVLCVEHHSAERCYNHTSEVVDSFLSVLAKHKR